MTQARHDACQSREWLLAGAAFLVTLAAAVAGNWQAADIVWSMWVSSITIGYAMILAAIVSGVWRAGRLAAPDAAISPPAARAARQQGVLGGVFLLAFFSLHFLGFHYGHAVFTQHFFPLPDMGATGRLPRLDQVVLVTLAAYWPVVLASLVNRQDGFRAALAGDGSKALLLPYRYVVKNHLVIFIVAGLGALGLDAYVLYAVFAWYYFPFELLKKDGGTPRP